MAGITVKIANVDRTEYVDARSLSILDELTNRASSASFDFICNDVAVAPIAGNAVLIEEDAIKLFSGRVLTKDESFLPPNLLKYSVECIDHTRDLDKKLVIESYLDELAGNILKDIITKYTTGFTTVHVSDGPAITRISFDYIQVSEAITKLAEACGYQWYVDHDKDLYFFLKTDYPASFQLDDDQEHYRDLTIDYDVSQLRNRVYVKSSKYETLDFTELFIGDAVTVTWTCKYQANPLPHPSLKLDGVVKTVGWDGVDPPADYHFMLNITTKVLSLGDLQGTPADGAEMIITYGADVPIVIKWDDQDSINAVIAIEGGDGIHEFCITDNNIDTKEWAIDVAKADLLQNADPVIQGNFLTNEATIKSGQIITLNSTKRNINQAFLVQRVELVRVDTILEEVGGAEIHLKPSATATIHLKPSAEAVVPLKPSVAYGIVIYYVYQVTIATKLKGLEDLLLQLLYQSSESLKRDTEAPDVPSGLALSTGMGEITQAPLAWLKATWDANTEDDFSHYELKYKKTAYSDYGYVTTTNTSYIWTGLEQNIEYEVYIRAVDIFGNRSAWSSQVLQVTATDEEAPDQITGAEGTSVLAGIKVIWDGATEGDIAGYIVERQESDDGEAWTLPWVEKTRINASMWLDLLLPYIVYYRYRVAAYTHTGVAGTWSTPTVGKRPNKAGADDIVAKCITADQIFGNELSIIFADMGTITAGTITLNTTGFIRSTSKTYGSATAGFWMGYSAGAYKFHIGTQTKYLKWDGVNLNIKGNITLINTIPNSQVDGLGDLALEDDIAYGDITGSKPPINADVTLSAINGELYITGGGLVLYSGGAKIRGGQTSYGVGNGFWLGDVAGTTKFSLGSSTNYLKWSGSILDISANVKLGSTNSIYTTGKTYYGDPTAGFWLGYSAGYKLDIGSSSQYLRWSGSALTIKGSIELMNTIPNEQVDGLGDLATEDDISYGEITGTKPPSNADVTLSAINGQLYITGGGIVLSSGSPKIRAGQTSYGSGTGFWLGLVSGTPKFSIGSSTNYLRWDGSAIYIKTSGSLSNINTNLGSITAGTISGVRFRVGAGTNEDIYFEDSGIRLYDAGSNNLYFTAANSSLTFNFGSNYVLVKSTVDRLYLGNVSRTLIFYSEGTLQLPSLYSAPTGHNGDMAYNSASGWFAFYAGGQWKHVKYWTTTW